MIATPTEIEYFLEVYRTSHVSNAAIRLGVTQPTLTQSLQKLEEKLNVKLFIRSKRGVVATEAGKVFYSRAKMLLENWEGVHNDLRTSGTTLGGRFKIGCHTAVAAYTIPKLLNRLNSSAPRIEIDLVHDFSRKITEQLVSYELDLGYVVNPARHPDLTLVKLGEDQVTFWKRKGREVPERLITDASLLQVQRLMGSSRSKPLASWPIVHTSSLELIRTLALAGEGVGILPERVAKVEGELVVYDKSLPVYQDEIYLAYRKEMLLSRAGKELIKLAKIDL